MSKEGAKYPIVECKCGKSVPANQFRANGKGRILLRSHNTPKGKPCSIKTAAYAG